MSTSCWLVYLCMQSLWNSTLISIYMELWLQFQNANVKKKKISRQLNFSVHHSHTDASPRCCILLLINDHVFQRGRFWQMNAFNWGRCKISKYISMFWILQCFEQFNVLNNFVKDIEKFYELNQQLSMDDLARSISFALKSGQWTMQKIPFSGEGQHTQGFVWWEWWAE